MVPIRASLVISIVSFNVSRGISGIDFFKGKRSLEAGADNRSFDVMIQSTSAMCMAGDAST